MNVHCRALTIGALAKATGVTTPTIRFYEEIGLLPKPSRTSGGQRHYDQADVGRLTFIRQSRNFGFGIEQVRALLALSASPKRDCVETRDIAQAHLEEVRRRLIELRALEEKLRGMVDDCNATCVGGPSQGCVISTKLAVPPLAGTTGCCG